MVHALTHLVRTQFLGLVALLLVLTGGAAYAATVAKDTVVSKSIKNGQVKTVDLKDGAVDGAKLADGSVAAADLADGSVGSSEVTDNSLTGSDINESSLGPVASAVQADNALTLGTLAVGSFMRSSVYRVATTETVGVLMGDGSYAQVATCSPGDLVIGGGPFNTLTTTDVVESAPTSGSLGSWTVRVQDNGIADPYRVAIHCVDQS